MNHSSLAQVRKILPNQVPVTLLVRQPGAEGSFVSYSLPFARYQELDDAEKIIHALVNVKSLGWEIWQEALDNAQDVNGNDVQAPTPKLKDVIVDSTTGLSWVIVSMKMRKLINNVFPMVCKEGVAQQTLGG